MNGGNYSMIPPMTGSRVFMRPRRVLSAGRRMLGAGKTKMLGAKQLARPLADRMLHLLRKRRRAGVSASQDAVSVAAGAAGAARRKKGRREAVPLLLRSRRARPRATRGNRNLKARHILLPLRKRGLRPAATRAAFPQTERLQRGRAKGGPKFSARRVASARTSQRPSKLWKRLPSQTVAALAT